MPESNRTKRGPGRPSTRHAKRRDDILHTAAGVFAEKGFHGASMRDIAARLGMRQAALYYYFPSKTGILEAICREGITHFVERIGAIAASPLPAQEKITRAIHAHLEPLVEQRFFVHAFLFQRRELPKSVRRPLDAQAHAYAALWRSIIEDGQRAGTVAEGLDPELTVLAILGMCNTVARWSRSVPAVSLENVSDTFGKLIGHGLFGAARKGRARRAPAGSIS